MVGWKSVGQVRTRSILSRRVVRESGRGLVSITKRGTGPCGVVGSCRLFVALLTIVGPLSGNDAAMLSEPLSLLLAALSMLMANAEIGKAGDGMVEFALLLVPDYVRPQQSE